MNHRPLHPWGNEFKAFCEAQLNCEPVESQVFFALV